MSSTDDSNSAIVVSTDSDSSDTNSETQAEVPEPAMLSKWMPTFTRVPSARRCLTPLVSRRCIFSWSDFKDALATMSNLSGTVNMLHRMDNWRPVVLKQLQQAQGWADKMQRKGGRHPELTAHISKNAGELMLMVNKPQGSNLSRPGERADVLRHVHEMCAAGAVNSVLTDFTTCRVRTVAGILVIYCWEDQYRLLQSLAEKLDQSKVPKLFRPVCQPMGDVDAKVFEESDVFSGVLAPAEGKWETLPSHQCSLEPIKRSRELWTPPPDDLHIDQGKVQRLRTVHGLEAVASVDGVLHLAIANGTEGKSKLMQYDIDGHELDWTDFDFNGTTGMAIADDMVAVCFPQKVICRGIEGNGPEWEVPHKFPVTGPSINDSHVHYIVGHSVVCMDTVTGKVHTMMGEADKEGSGSTKDPPAKLLLNNPTATAVVDHFLFVADAGNQRVIGWDLKGNECIEVFRGKCPKLLAAYSEGVCVYDEGDGKIFHVSMGTWKKFPFMGTGTGGYSPEGLPPLSTNLGKLKSMTICHASHDRTLVFTCEDDDRLLTCVLPSFCESPQFSGPLSPIDVPGEKQDALVVSKDLQPTCGETLKPFSGRRTRMIVSEALPGDQKRMSIKWTMLAPQCQACVCLVAEHLGKSNTRSVDTHMTSLPAWNTATFVTTLSKVNKFFKEQKEWEETPFQKGLEAGMNKFKEWVAGSGNMESAEQGMFSEPFHFRDENRCEAVVETEYDGSRDCLIWKFVSLKINGKQRAGVLKDLVVGVDMKVRLCIFSYKNVGILEFPKLPKVSVKGSYM